MKLSRAMIERVLTACEDGDARELGSLMALLRRFDVEAARKEARETAQKLFAPDPAPQVAGPNDRRRILRRARRIVIDLQAIEAELAA